ncbi:hypothetical protein [Halosolutus gelatinilyticus]|uniref:hypothetical protein n=1 Tax=Halosolutus gelatinilyticus TaxID=2931975 RepID=UPI001FF3A97D|nr:hypothetical protein [Halosolutus gelatinilyticus]
MIDTVGKVTLANVRPEPDPLAFDVRDPGEIAVVPSSRDGSIRDRPEIDALLADADRLT